MGEARSEMNLARQVSDHILGLNVSFEDVGASFYSQQRPFKASVARWDANKKTLLPEKWTNQKARAQTKAVIVGMKKMEMTEMLGR